MPKFDYIASLLLNALRKYNIEDVIIGGDRECKHEWGREFKAKQSGGGWAKPNYKGGQKKDWDLGEVSQGNFCLHCQAWKGQFGLEPTPELYVKHTRLWAKEAWRVLRKDGVFFLNLADSYNSHSTGQGNVGGIEGKRKNKEDNQANIYRKFKYPDKCQLLVPHRVAIALVDDGWVLRNTIVWHKPNAMPESVTDRFSKKYEYIFFFTKQGDYYFDLDAVREKCPPLNRWGGNKLIAKGQSEWDKSTGQVTYRDRDMQPNDGMKNPGDVWSIPTQPSSEKHYSMWPERLVERMILCSTKAGDTVLDPFCGSGTTLKVAKELYRDAIGIDLGYQEMAARRLANVQKRLI